LDIELEARFYDILVEEARKERELSAERRADLAKLTAHIIDLLRLYLGRVDFWRSSPSRTELQRKIASMLDDHRVVSLDRQEAVADRLVDLAKALNQRLWLPARVQRFAPRVDVRPAGVTIRDLGFRWGSCSASGRLNFHWQTMLLEPELIDYIVVHELVHLKLRRHNAAFWRLVERVIPNYQERQNRLIEKGRLAIGPGWN
jgi:predicted metal-dependent hydrolase